MMRDGFINTLRRWSFTLRSWRSYSQYLNRRVNVENILAAVAQGKRPLLTRDECRELARYLGTRDYKLTVRADGVRECPKESSVNRKPTIYEPISPEQVAQANATEAQVSEVLRSIGSDHWEVVNAAELVRKLIAAGLIAPGVPEVYRFLPYAVAAELWNSRQGPSEPTRSQKPAEAGFTRRKTGKTAGGLMPEDDSGVGGTPAPGGKPPEDSYGEG